VLGPVRFDAATNRSVLCSVRIVRYQLDAHIWNAPKCSTPIAGVRCAAEQRSELEHLCRYITRPAIANERLRVNHARQVVLQLKTPYHYGTNHIVMSPLELMQRLAALVSRPRLHLIRFRGVLAPNARLRSKMVPGDQRTAASEKRDRLFRVGSVNSPIWKAAVRPEFLVYDR